MAASSSSGPPLPPSVVASIERMNDLVTTDAGGRGMKHLVVPGDLLASAKILARLHLRRRSVVGSGRHRSDSGEEPPRPRVVVLTGFPCCVDESPPTETDGLASVAIARAALRLGYDATLVAEECHAPVFHAAVAVDDDDVLSRITLSFVPSVADPGPAWLATNDASIQRLAASADLVVACERAGPAVDGRCYTMRGIDMTARGLINPALHLVPLYARREEGSDVPFVAIGDGGNELGMGKVLNAVRKHVPDGDRIGAATPPADRLIAASVSNWGAYALIAAAAVVRFHDDSDRGECEDKGKEEWIDRVLPTEEAEAELIRRCVAAGCRDGVSGKMEATVDGMPLERSMECLREIRKAALGEY